MGVDSFEQALERAFTTVAWRNCVSETCALTTRIRLAEPRSARSPSGSRPSWLRSAQGHRAGHLKVSRDAEALVMGDTCIFTCPRRTASLVWAAWSCQLLEPWWSVTRSEAGWPVETGVAGFQLSGARGCLTVGVPRLFSRGGPIAKRQLEAISN